MLDCIFLSLIVHVIAACTFLLSPRVQNVLPFFNINALASNIASTSATYTCEVAMGDYNSIVWR